MATTAPASVFFLSMQLFIRAETRPQDDPLLKSVCEKVSQSVERLPNYLCTQTIHRSQMDLDSRDMLSCSQLEEMKRSPRHITSQDRLRLDVGVGGKAEMYAWAGQSQFIDSGILGLVRFGPISTGSFSGFLKAIFTRNIATYQKTQSLIRDGRSMVEYSFTVPRESNSYLVHATESGWFFTAYSGTFTVDSITA